MSYKSASVFILAILFFLLINTTLGGARMVISLNGIWEASYDSKNFNLRLRVPGMVPIENETYPEPESLKVWYRRSFHVNKSFEKAFLKFYGVDNFCRVYLNGKKVGEHRGGFDSFDFDVSDILKTGKNDILVYVEDKPLKDSRHEVVGKQHWYGNCTGIWQDVELILLEDESYFKEVTYELSDKAAKVSCEIEGDWDEIDYQLFDDEELIKEGKENMSEFSISSLDVDTWSPENPKLYTLILKLVKDGKIVDRIEKRIGFRKIESKNGKIFLNGEPIYLKGLLDQDFYPETGYVPPSKDYIKSQFEKIKHMGFNLVRYHVKIPPRIYMEAADEVGILVWLDLPYANRLNRNSKNYLEELARDVKRRYSANPSFIILTLINESWGLNLNWSIDRNWLESFWKETKKMFSDRLIVDNSPCCGNKHIMSDINDYHFYFSYPDNREAWDKTIERFANGAFKTFYTRRKRSQKELFRILELPKVVSEFGCWGLPDPLLFTGKWFEYPVFGGKSVEDFMDFEKLYYKTPTEMAVDSQWKEFWTLKYQIESMRTHPEIVGYVLTELSDISWEANGVLDFDRNPKVFAPYMKWLNSSILPIYKGNTLYLSNTFPYEIKCRVVAFLNREKILDKNLTLPSFDVYKIGLRAERGLLRIKVFDEFGEVVGQNFYYIFKWERADFPVQKSITKELLERVEKGQIALVELEKEGEYLDGKITVVSTNSPAFGFGSYWTDWQGNWIGAFYYYHPSLRKFLTPSLGGMELASVLRDKVILGDGKILIGKYIGWNLAKCAYLIEISYGKGKLILTTLKLENTELGKRILEILTRDDG